MGVVLAVLGGYLLGAVPFAYLAGRFKGIDIRRHGSGNMGTTNAFRVLGKKMGLLVFVGDFAKGLLAAQLGLSFGGAAWGPWLAIVTGILALLGHSWNPFFGFRPTGKGVATGAGVAMRLMPIPALLALAVFLLVTYFTRYVSMGSIIGALVAVTGSIALQNHVAYMVFTTLGASLVIARHRSNLKRIRQGNEPKVGWRIKI